MSMEILRTKGHRKSPAQRVWGKGKTCIPLALLTSHFTGQGSDDFSCRRWKELRRTEVLK